MVMPTGREATELHRMATGATVEVLTIPDPYEQSIQTKVATGDKPDLAFWQPTSSMLTAIERVIKRPIQRVEVEGFTGLEARPGDAELASVDRDDRPPRNPVVPESALAGYAGKSLGVKLGIKPNSVVALLNAPPDFTQS